MADHLTAAHHHALKEERLREAYGAIVLLLEKMGVSATFALTELLLLSREALLALPAEEIGARLPYAKPAFDDLRNGSRDGWSAPWALELIGDRHEIASHGVTHTPWGRMTAAQARYELSLVPRPAGQTFIYPRNQIAHRDVLKDAGFLGYRLPPPARCRFASLASEFNPLSPAETQTAPAELQPIPGGYFINCLSGPRRLVPPALTRLRARRVLEDAAHKGGVAHFWTHPENIASAPATFVNLRAVVEEAAALRSKGRIEIITQLEYCRLITP